MYEIQKGVPIPEIVMNYTPRKGPLKYPHIWQQDRRLACRTNTYSVIVPIITYSDEVLAALKYSQWGRYDGL